jgi:hypothetical protein
MEFGTRAYLKLSGSNRPTSRAERYNVGRILNICFPTEDMDFVINPEAYPLPGAHNGLRADLIVREVDLGAGGGYVVGRTFVYVEGKGGNNPITLQNLRTQMVNYLGQAIGNVQGRSCWAIGAHGRNVYFWRYTSRFVGDQRMVPVTWNGGIHSPNTAAGALVPAYSIAGAPVGTVGDWGSVQNILEHMSQYFAPF